MTERWVHEGKFVLAETKRGVDIFWADDCLIAAVDSHTGTTNWWFVPSSELMFDAFMSYKEARKYLARRDDRRWRSNAAYLEAYR